MAAALFSVLYNIVLTVVLTLAACCVMFLYAHYKRPVLLALCVMFAAYLLDNTIVFCTEIIPEFGTVYDELFLETPSVKTIYFIVLVSCLLYALHCAIPVFSTKQMVIIIFIYSAVLICIPMISWHKWMVFIYYFITQFLVILISIWGLVILRNTESSFDRGVVRRVMLYCLCMSILVLAEDSIVIFSVDRFYGPRMKINNRNYSENLMYLGFALPVLRHTIHQLKQAASEAPQIQTVDPPNPEKNQMDFYTFATAYNLTDREQEILFHLLQSKSQQAISEELIIALGTVKTHIHNIYQKTDSSNRSQIIAKYQEFCRLRNGDSPASDAE